jgi:pilus assembly protein CpaB
MWLPVHNASATPHAAAVEPGVPVVLAATPIAYGSKLEAKELVVAKIPASAVPAGAFSSIDQVLKQDGGGAPVALVAMQPHEPVLPVKLSGPGARQTLSAVLDDGMRAYTIAVSEVAGGGGHILPGDRVDVVLTRQFDNQTPVDGVRANVVVTQLVLQNVKVLGMDLNVDPNSTHPTVAHTATLEVGVQDAEKLALAAQAGSVSLALRRLGSTDVAPAQPIISKNMGLPENMAAAHTRPGASTGRGHSAQVKPATAVIIVNGEHRDRVDVPAERIRAGA